MLHNKRPICNKKPMHHNWKVAAITKTRERCSQQQQRAQGPPAGTKTHCRQKKNFLPFALVTPTPLGFSSDLSNSSSTHWLTPGFPIQVPTRPDTDCLASEIRREIRPGQGGMAIDNPWVSLSALHSCPPAKGIIPIAMPLLGSIYTFSDIAS